MTRATCFPTLAAGNTKNVKWKKYFYRKLCEAEGFRHAPHRIAGILSVR